MDSKQLVVTFDIDGTLVVGVTTPSGKKGNHGHKDSLSAGVKAACGVDVHVDDVPHQGRTDREVCALMMELKGVSANEELVQKAIDAATVFAEGDIDWATGLKVLPGVKELLSALVERSVNVGLVTGNVESIAYKKMNAVGLRQFFSFGGFGGQFTTRTECVKHANEHIKSKGVTVARSFHVGDAPADIAAATDSDVTSLGVLTGKFTEPELRAAATKGQPPHIVKDLSDLDAVLKIFGLL
ncbi:Phosphoglycolate phosphatase [Diplonema papillatum]|nr:Phosphoglycolate phosphatase [Diplonema papillatum]